MILRHNSVTHHLRELMTSSLVHENNSRMPRLIPVKPAVDVTQLETTPRWEMVLRHDEITCDPRRRVMISSPVTLSITDRRTIRTAIHHWSYEVFDIASIGIRMTSSSLVRPVKCVPVTTNGLNPFVF